MESVILSKIRRARDTADDEEKEILSSTSANVREIWDGTRVVRQTGESKTTILLFDENCFDQPGHARYPLQRLEILGCPSRNAVITHDSRRYWKPPGDYRGLIHARSLDTRFWRSEDISTNLTLSNQGVILSGRKSVGFVFIGILIQCAVMGFNALVVYYWKKLRAGKLVAPYGYPLWAAGTMALSIGTMICGSVIESSCHKLTVQPKKDFDLQRKLKRTIFFQRAISEQNIPTYAIELIEPGAEIQISKRIFPPTSEQTLAGNAHAQNNEGTLGKTRIRNPNREERTQETKSYQGEAKRRNWYTAGGALLALLGFLGQNFGTRELHWSAGVSQLVVTITLTLLRAWVRRRVGSSLESSNQTIASSKKRVKNSNQKSIVELEQGFEAYDLATRLTKYQCCLPIFFRLIPSANLREGDLAELEDEHTHFRSLELQQLNLCKVSSLHDEGILRNFLKIQSILGNCVGNNEKNIATACYKTMNEILEKLGIRTELVLLRHFIYMKMTEDADPPRITQELTPLAFPSPMGTHPNDTIDLLKAIIDCTCYQYAQMRKQRHWRSIVARIVGHASFDEVKAYSHHLNAWIRPLNGIKFVCVSNESDEKKSQQGRFNAVFGIQFSAAFQRSSNSHDNSTQSSDL